MAIPPPLRAALFGLLAGATVLGCETDVEDAPAVELTHFRQKGRSGICLDETLVFHFSAELDRASITSESVRIRGPANLPASGNFVVKGSTLEFVPELPRARDLSDGGLRLGCRYLVEILGFPAPNGVRSRDGTPLASTYRAGFRTALLEGDERVFLTPFLEHPAALVPVADQIGPLDPIVLECGEALDPSTIDGSQFHLMRSQEGRPSIPIPLRATLTVNRREYARLELRAISSGLSGSALPALDPGDYTLIRREGYAVASLCGLVVEPSWHFNLPALKVITVVVQGTGRLRESFHDSSNRSPRAVDGADGTAAWGHGRVEINFPRAAGDGRDGLGEDRLAPYLDDATKPETVSAPFDLAATRLTIPADSELDFSSRTGLVLLRTQGALVVDGTLRRFGAQGAASMAPALGSRHSAGLLLRHEREARRRAPDATEMIVPATAPGTLSEWIDHALAQEIPWTILIAGGDLVVSGRIDSDGPLMLIAGGWIRVSGNVEAWEVWRTEVGGGSIVALGGGGAQRTTLYLDPPLENPLRTPLSFRVLSDPIRPPRGVTTWRLPRIEGTAGGGDFRVRFLGEQDVGYQGIERYGPLDNLDWLLGCEAVRLWIELDVGVGGEGVPWDPPYLDEVEISWYEPPQRGE